MGEDFSHLVSVDQIRARFDADVERFSKLELGQNDQSDAALQLELVARAALSATPHATRILDVGCGGGNYTLRLLQIANELGVKHKLEKITLIDLSANMLERAAQRVGQAFAGELVTKQTDVRDYDFGEAECDVIVTGQCLHHLRGEAEWRTVFTAMFRGLAPGGGLWIVDTVEHETPAVERMMWDRWADFLVTLGGEAYRDHVLDYVRAEDTPRPLAWQLERLREAGFASLDVLHKSSRFASFGGVKAA